MRIRQRQITGALASFAAIGLALSAAPASAVVVEYTSAALFNIAAPVTTTYNFEGIASPGTVECCTTPITRGGVSFTSVNGSLFVLDALATFGSPPNRYTHYGVSNLAGEAGPISNVTATLAAGVYAIGFTYGSYIDSAAPFTISLNTGGPFAPLVTPVNNGTDTGFVGFTSTVPITSVSFTESGIDFDLLKFQLAPVPLPATAWLLLSGLACVGAMARRRRPFQLNARTAISR